MEQENAEIARGLRSGDPDLLDRLIERFQHRLFRYLLSLTGHRQTAEDLFQETWLRVLERGGQYRGRWKFETWLFSIARHLVIDRSRQKKALSLDDLLDPADSGQPMELPDSTSPSAFDLLAEGEEEQQLGQAVTGLPAVYREVLVLRFQEDLQLEEIARVANVPLSTVKSRLYRGLEALRQRMREQSRGGRP